MMRNNLQILVIIFISLVSDCHAVCSPYVNISGMANSVDNICRYNSYTTMVRLEVQLLHDVTAGDCDTLEWTVTQVVWKIHSFPLGSTLAITADNLQESVTTYTGVMAEDEVRDNGVYGVVVQGTAGNQQFNVEGYMAVKCAPAHTDDICKTTRQILNMTVTEYKTLNFCQDTSFTTTVNGDAPTEAPAPQAAGQAHKGEEPTTTVQPVSYEISLSCISNCKSLANPLEEIEFELLCVQCGSVIVTYDWTTADCFNGEVESCYLDITSYPEHQMSTYFSYVHRDLQALDKPYAVMVTANFPGGMSSEASYMWTFSPIPVAGSCEVSPASGYALMTAFNITCQGFSVSGGHQLQYTFKTKLPDSSNTGVQIYTGLSPNVDSVMLQSGNEQSDYYFSIEITAAVESGASAVVTASVQVLPPSLSPDGNQVLDLVQDLISVGDSSEESTVGNLLEAGDDEEAVHLMGVISSTINTDTDQADDTVKQQRTEVRTALVESLQQVNVSSFEMVTALASVLNDATGEPEELTDTAQTKAASLYEDLADTLGAQQGDKSMTEVTGTAEAILTGVTKILDIKTDIGKSQLNDTQQNQNQAADMEEVRAVSTKLLNAVDKVSSTLMSRKVVGQNATVLQTDKMTISLERLTRASLMNRTLRGSGGAAEGEADLMMPASLPDSAGDGNLGVQLVHLQKNPYVWDDTASEVSSNVLSLDLKDDNNTAVNMTNLIEPLRISFRSNDDIQLSNASLYLHLVKADGNVTLNPNMSNLVTFNFTTIPDKLITLKVTPLVNISLLKMHISAENKPNLSEILDSGFIYPSENVSQHSFASFELEKNFPNRSDTIFFTHNKDSGNFKGEYYVGLAVDLQNPEVLASLQILDPSCLGDDTTSSCGVEIKIPLQIETTNFGCMYWDKNLQRWSDAGCEVSPFSTKETVQCLCSHMTAFAGGVFVLPNFVDPIGDAALFLTFFENPVVVTTVIIIWVIYFFLLHWARRADWKDNERVGVISCPDNEPAHKYIYLVCIATGWWKDAGTTANVYFYMKGSIGESPKRCLTCSARPCFQVGYEDWFLLTTSKSLGQLEEVTVWHDNTGPSPHWYFTQVYVKDLQTSQNWTFIFNDWLAADRGSTMHTRTTIPAITDDDLKFQKRHNFMLKSSKDLRDGHLWISIFSKPVQSTFSRPQRLTCALSLLLCTMLTNIMFYGVPTDVPEDQLAGLQISLTTIMIGIQSSLLMFPVNLIILQMFLRVKPRPREAAVKRRMAKASQSVHKYIQNITDGIFGDMELDRKLSVISSSAGVESPINLQDPKDLTAGFKQSVQSAATVYLSAHSNLVVEIEENMREDTHKPTGKFLPWWFVYVAWAVVLSTCVITSYFVMLYGLKYGYMKSIAWLVSFVTGFTQSAFLTQPIKVIALAMIFTLVLKKNVPFEDFGPGVELDDDEVYLQGAEDRPTTHIPYSEPLSALLVAKLKHRLRLVWLMNATIRDIVLYIVYLTVVMLMVHGHRNIRQVYLSTNALEDLLVNPGCVNTQKCFFLAKADSVDRMYQYLYDNALPSLTDMSQADHDFATPGSSHFLIGPFRLRQLRVAQEECSLSDAWIFERFGITGLSCTNAYWIGNEDTTHYNGSWASPLPSPPTSPTPWTHQSSWQLKTMPLTGKYATYSGGGYVLQIASDPSSQADQITDMWNSDWIDGRTRAVFLEFTLYNPNADLFSVVIIMFEFTNVGSVTPGHQIFTAKLYHNSSDFGTVVLVSECLFLIFNLGFAYIEYKRYRKLGRKEYLSDVWNYLELLQMCLAFAVVGLFFQRMVSVSSILDDYRQTDSSEFVSFYTALFWDMILGYVMAHLVCLVTLKFIKLLRFNKRTFMVGDALSNTKGAMLSFLFMVIVFFIAFAHFGLISFGGKVYDYRSMYASLMSVFNFGLGVSDLPGLQSANRILGPAFFVLFVFLAHFCCLTIFMVILNVGIIKASDMLKKRKSKFELMEYITSRVKLVLGLK